MKTLLYLFFAIVGLICAISALAVLSTQPTNGVQVLGLLSLAIFGLALAMIFGFTLYHHVKENKLYDLAAQEQLERDWYYYEQQCAEELYSVGKRNFENSN